MIDNSTRTWTPEEIAALPQVEKVFDAPELVINQHDWMQQGYMIVDWCNPKKTTCLSTGLQIPTGKLLIKTKGGYELVDEVTRK